MVSASSTCSIYRLALSSNLSDLLLSCHTHPLHLPFTPFLQSSDLTLLSHTVSDPLARLRSVLLLTGTFYSFHPSYRESGTWQRQYRIAGQSVRFGSVSFFVCSFWICVYVRHLQVICLRICFRVIFRCSRRLSGWVMIETDSIFFISMTISFSCHLPLSFYSWL